MPRHLRLPTRFTLARPLLVLLLTVTAIFGVTTLVDRVDSSRKDQLAIGALSQTITSLEAAPFSADPRFNSGPEARSPKLAVVVRARIRAAERGLSDGLTAAARSGAPGGVVATGRSSLSGITVAVADVYGLATARGGLAVAGAKHVAAAQNLLEHRLGTLRGVLVTLNTVYAARADRARSQAEAGTVVAMILLLTVFGYFYFRSESLGREKHDLLALSQGEARTDVLTGLGNRRALTDELAIAVEQHAAGGEELLVMIFDLDGFKQYNDTFGHAAGDALLTRLGHRLAEAVAESGSAYRMGGDEFCVIAPCASDAAEALLDDTLSALSDGGEGWHITASQGAVWVPSEATTASQALQTADERMYANKAGRTSASRQIADVLLQVLTEQDTHMNVHGGRVAELSATVAEALDQPDREIQRIRLAATLHDIGKTAIPESLLNKAGPLNEQEWEFMHRHTLIGERIVLAAPALATTAPLIRSSHERLDGTGYPDGLRGAKIPLGSRIIAACDAYDAMTSDRAYRDAGSVKDALTELRRCIGTQFDPQVVSALSDAVTASHPSTGADPAAAA